MYSHFWKKVVSYILVISLFFSYCPALVYADQVADDAEILSQEELAGAGTENQAESKDSAVDTVPSTEIEHEHFADSQIGDDVVDDDVVDFSVYNTDCSPIIVQQPQSVECRIGEFAVLSVSAIADGGGKLSYQWYVIANSMASVIEGETKDEFYAPTDVAGSTTYYCAVSNTIAENVYTIQSDEATVLISSSEDDVSTEVSNNAEEAYVTITEQPVDATCGKDEAAVLKVAATAPEGAALTYQWYEVSGETATAIEGATEASYTAPTGEVGEKSYYCVVTNTVNKLTYTAQSDTVKVTVRENIEVVTDLKIVAGNYSASNPSGYVDVLDGSFNRNTTEYQNITITDISSGFKVYVALSDEIKAKGLVAYEISYDGVPGTGRADSGYLSNGSDGMCVPFQFNRSSIALGKESVVSVEIGTRSGTKFTVSETYSFHITYIRGLTRLRVMENSKNVLNPNSTTRATSTFLNEYTGKLAAGTEKVSVQVKPEDSSATAYIGGTAFTTTSYVAEISLANYISENGKTVEIPVRLEWPATDSSLPTQTRNYSVKLELVSYTPTITEQPVDATCGKDEAAVLKVAATAPEGAALTYQWYEVSGETATAIEGATEASYTAPTGEVGEKSYYCVVTNTVNKLTYATQSDTVKVSVFHWDVKQPRILAQPHDITCTPNERVSLSVQIEEPEAGYCRYLWYNADSNELILNGNNVFEPNTSEVGVKEYYCVIRWFYGNETYDFKTATAKVTVDAGWNGSNYTPVILQQPKKTTCNKGDTCYLSVDVKAPEDGVLSYQWRTISGQPVEGATEAEFTPPTDAAGIRHYLCEVTNTVNGVAYSIYSSSAYVNVKLTYINTPTIVKNFGTYYKENYKNEVYTDYQKEYEVGELPKSVYLQFEQSDTGVEFRVETYHNTVESFEGAELLEKAVANCGIHGTNEKAKHIWEYHVDLNQEFAIGTHFFYCIVTAYNPKDSSMPPQSLLMGPVAITYKDAPIGFDGDGTVEVPYLIKTADDLVLLQTLVSEGKAFGGRYFRIVNDITLPDDWKPIGCTKDGTNIVNGMSNLNPFSGIIDGKISESKNATITVPAGGLPLIGFVKDAYVKNLNIKGERIEGAGLVNNYTGVNLSGNAVTIENVRLLSGTKTLKSGLVASVGGNGFAHASAGFTVTIRDCTIEDNVIIGYSGTQSGIGSFAGKINGSVENCTSYATVKGTSYVGGIIAGRDNAMSQCSVKNSAFHGTVESSGSYAGGIVGGGYDNSTAPNGACPTILACTVDGTVNGNERVGGIFGGDGFVAQTWDNVVGSISANSFTGKVSGNKYVGAIIGYRQSLNRYDNIAGNTYSAGCGADKGIGYVKYLDTSYANPTKMDGTIVFSTEGTTKDCPAVAGCAWRANHNRTDDPLGKDADKLCRVVGGSTEPICYELTASGTYKTEYTVGDELDLTGIVLTASWSNGTTTDVALSDVTVEGYDQNKVAIQTITLKYGDAVAYITVTVKPESVKITVSVSILGDEKHGAVDEPHGLARGGLTAWAEDTSVEADTAETVWDVLQRVAKSKDIELDAFYSEQYGSYYIRGVNGLSEKDNGENSGWMYTVNGKHPEVGVSARFVNENDQIILHYTDDYTYEEDGENYGKEPPVTPKPDKANATELLSGKSTTLKVLGKNGKVLGKNDITWTLKDPQDSIYATISATGTVKAKTVLTKHDVTFVGTLKGSYEGTVEQVVTILPKVTQVEIMKDGDNVTGKTLSLNAEEGETLTLTAMVYPDELAQEVTWKSSNTKIAQIDAEGTVSFAGKTGSVTVTATSTDGSRISATVKLQVGVLTKSVTIAEPADHTLRSGKSLTLKATTDPVKPTVSGVTFKLVNASDSAYVSVSTSGRVSAKTVNEPHVVKIHAVSKDAAAVESNEITLTILPKNVQSLILKSGDKYVTNGKVVRNVNEELTLKAYTLDTTDGAVEETRDVTWTSSNTKVATIDETGKVTCVKTGTVKLTATADKKTKATVTLKVTNLVDGITIVTKNDKDAMVVASGKSLALKATVQPANASQKAVTWSMVSGSRYAKISSSGVVSANKGLTSPVTVTVKAVAKDGSGMEATQEITINPVALGVTISDVNHERTTGTLVWNMTETDNIQFSANVYPVKAVQAVTWKSSNAKIAAVDGTGKVTCYKAGTVTITATAKDGSGKKASFKLNIIKKLKSLTLEDQTVEGGKSLQLKAILDPVDPTNKKLTWTVSSNNVGAKISSSGKLTTKKVTKDTKVMVTVSSNDGTGLTATCFVTITPSVKK